MSARAAEAGITGIREYVTVRIAGQLFGFPIEEIHEVFRPHGVAAVPLARPEIAGVLNIRGRIITAIDMRPRLDLPPRDADTPCMAVGIEHGGESYGLLVDEVGEVLQLARGALEPNPVNLDRGWAYVAAGVHRLEKDVLVILDVKRLLALAPDESLA